MLRTILSSRWLRMGLTLFQQEPEVGNVLERASRGFHNTTDTGFVVIKVYEDVIECTHKYNPFNRRIYRKHYARWRHSD